MNTTIFSRCLHALAAAALSATAVLPCAAQSASAPPPASARVTATAQDDDPNGARVIVKYKAQASLMRAAASAGSSAKGPQHASTLAGRTGLALSDGRIVDRHSQVVRAGKGISSAALAARLAADPDVEYAVPDRRRHVLAVPNDSLFSASDAISPAAGQWYLRAPDATFVSAINAVGAWDISSGSATVVVADIDTGVRFGHPDLANKLLPGYDFITDPTTAADGDGPDADATDPGDWTNAGDCGFGSHASTSTWHGTQTAGLIGAQTNNALGMASVGRNVMLLPVRVLGKCGGLDSDIIAGMLWAGGVSSLPVVNTRPARVINMSLGGIGLCSQVYKDAIGQLTAAGVVIVVAAGNDDGLAVESPANCPGVIAVAGVRNFGTKVGFSNIGPEVALAAPGGNCINIGPNDPCLFPILSTTNSGTQGPLAASYTDSLDAAVGTSFSAPLVAGTAALMISANPALTPAQVKTILQDTARAFPSTSTNPAILQCRTPDGGVQEECLCTTSTCGAGMLDAAAAVATAAATAAISVRSSSSSSAVVIGGTVDLDSSNSLANGGNTITSYRWDMTSGATIANFSSPTDRPTAQLTGTGVGTVLVRLTLTDNTGHSASTTTLVSVTAAPAPAGDSGGGAMQVGWLAGLVLAVLMLTRRRHRARG